MQIRTIIKRPSSVGIILGTILLGISLTPSLIPRTWIQQAVIAAVSFISGYGVGVGINALWRYLELPTFPPGQPRKRATQISLAVSGVILVYFLFRSLAWQNSLRQLVGLEPVDSTYPLRMILLAAVVAAILLIFFRFLSWLAQTAVRLITKVLPHRYGQVIGILIAGLLIVFIVNGMLIGAIFDGLNATYSVRDGTTYENVVQPTSALRSGSPESLADWTTLGREGRRFVGTGPTATDIAAFWGEESAADPIRIYIGSKSADSLQARSDLALQELIRTNGFERDVLILVTSTGNGWVDSNALNSLEYINRGNTTTVAFQYSYLPSVYSLMADKDAATEASVSMFNTIHRYWQELDEDTRPEFYLHGLSLGAYGSQAAVSNVNLFNDPIDGALWAGPPFVSEFWRQITKDREVGTPVWRPVYQGGTTIRFTNQGEDLAETPETWLDNRIIYLQQAGDPIVFFTPSSLYRAPEWLHEDERSPKAPAEMKWYPVVTFWQLIFDMVLGTSDTLPDGNGHRYASGSYIDSWIALMEPADWSSAQTEQLKELFLTMDNPNKP